MTSKKKKKKTDGMSVDVKTRSHKKKKSKGSATPSLAASSSKTKRKSSSNRPLSTHSKFFPGSGASQQQLESKIIELETRVRDLGRDNQVLVRKLEKIEGSQNKKAKKLNNEKDMRLAANKERYWLRQKLNRLQLAIEARLKMLGIDFSNISDLGEALEAAFAAIQKLAAELAKKEEELQMMNSKFNRSQKRMEENNIEMDKVNRKLNKMKNALEDSKRAVADRERQLDDASNANNSASDAQSLANQEILRLKEELEKLRNLKNQQFDEFIDQKAEMERSLREKDQTLQDLNHNLEMAGEKNAKIQASNDKMQAELERMRVLLDKQNEKLMEEREKNKELTQSTDEEIAQMKLEMQELNDENAALKEKLAEMEQRLADMQETIEDQDEELADYKRQMEEERAAKETVMVEKDNNDEENRELLENLENELSGSKELAARLQEENDEKDNEIERLRKALADAQAELDGYLNRERFEKGVQTDINGSWFDNAAFKLANIDRIETENDELRQLAHKNDVRLDELVNENQQLLDEIDVLLKQQAQFKPCNSNHRGEIKAMRASPSRYIVATSSTDKSVRVWSINPEQAKPKDQVQVILRSQMEGIALSLAFTRDGKYLVAGCAYKNGPDGLLIVWDMTKGDGEVEFLFRSRPSIRFGRAHCVCWSDNSQYIFSGDTTGAIWVWDVVRQIQLAVLHLHKDVVHDIGVARNCLFSCSLDQTMKVFSLPKLAMVKVKKNKVHVHKPKVFKGTQLDRNDKYAYWKVAPTPDCKFILAGSRKVSNWTVVESKNDNEDCSIGKAPRISDTDMDHIQSMQVQRNLVCIARKNTSRAKIFDIGTGQEAFKARFKGPVSKVNFLHDHQNCIVCVQKYNGKKAVPPTMHLWHYRK